MAHIFHFRYRKGRRIHSPFLFSLLSKAVYNADKWQVPEAVKRALAGLNNDPSPLKGKEMGAGSMLKAEKTGTVGQFYQRASSGQKQGALLYRLAKWAEPDRIVELGTGLGSSALYLHAGAPRATLDSIEGNVARANYAEELFKRCGLTGIKVHKGDVGELLPSILSKPGGRLLAFVDANHRFESTLHYAELLIASAGDGGLIVLDDLYWSREMYRAWRVLIQKEEVSVSIDLYHQGLLLLRPDLHPRSLKIWF